MRCRKLYEVYGIRLSTNTNVNSNTNTKIATIAQTCSTILIILGIKQVVTSSAIECWTSDWSWPRGRSLLAVSQLFTSTTSTTIIYSDILNRTPFGKVILPTLRLNSHLYRRHILVYVVWPIGTLLSWLPSTLKNVTGPTTLTSTPSLPSSSWLAFHHTLVK